MVTIPKRDHKCIRTPKLCVAIDVVYAGDVSFVLGSVELGPGGAVHQLMEVT